MPIYVQQEGYTQSSNLGYLTTNISETRNKREGENILNIKSAWFPQNPPEEPESEPVHYLYEWYEADAQAKATDATQTWDEVQPGHPLRPLKF